MIEHHYLLSALHIYAGNLQSHQGPVGFIPTGFPIRIKIATAVSVAVSEAFVDCAIGLDTLRMSVNDVAQQLRIITVATRTIQFKESVARKSAESRCPMLVLCACPYSPHHIRARFGQHEIRRENIVKRDSPCGAKIAQALTHFEILAIAGNFIQAHHSGGQGNCRFRVGILKYVATSP